MNTKANVDVDASNCTTTKMGENKCITFANKEAKLNRKRLFVDDWGRNEAITIKSLKGGLDLISGLTTYAEDGISDEERCIISNFCEVMGPRLEQFDEFQLGDHLLLNVRNEHFEEIKQAARKAAIEVDKKYRPHLYR